MKKKTAKVICDNCGNVAPFDKEKSTENWKVFNTSMPCDKCGEYKWVAKFEEGFIN